MIELPASLINNFVFWLKRSTYRDNHYCPHSNSDKKKRQRISYLKWKILAIFCRIWKKRVYSKNPVWLISFETLKLNKNLSLKVIVFCHASFLNSTFFSFQTQWDYIRKQRRIISLIIKSFLKSFQTISFFLSFFLHSTFLNLGILNIIQFPHYRPLFY